MKSSSLLTTNASPNSNKNFNFLDLSLRKGSMNIQSNATHDKLFITARANSVDRSAMSQSILNGLPVTNMRSLAA